MRKFLVVLLVVMLTMSGCTESASSYSQEDYEYVERIKQGRDNLLGYSDYIISNEFLGEVYTTSLVVRSGNIQYVEYPISDSGEVETRSFMEGGKYGLSEYRDSDGKWYQLVSDGSILRFPDKFGEYRDDLRVMYIDRLLDSGSNFKSEDDMTLETLFGDETFSVISFDVDSLAVRDTVANPEYGAYRSAADTVKDDNVKNYAELVATDITDVFTCSTVSCKVILDKLNTLRGVFITAKGGGSRLYNSAVVINLHNDVVREKPDLSNAQPFVASLVEVGFATAGASSYDEAVSMLSDLASQEQSGGDMIEAEP